MDVFLEFEKPIATLEKKLQDLRDLSKDGTIDLKSEIQSLEKKITGVIDDIFSKLTPWQKVQLSRHPNRPYFKDYVDLLFPDFMELHGDRTYGEDKAIIAGIASWPPVNLAQLERSGEIREKDRGLGTMSVLLLGHQKGRSTKQKMERNFGMAKPEGYRKAIRLMDLANRMKMPIITFIDTPGAYPGIETEERGQAQAIAESIRHMFSLDVPVIAVVIGEGGSGGALAIGVANRVLMQEYSTYSVISPEGCASILWSDSKLAERASEKLKMNPEDLQGFEVIDRIISEPRGGAHRDWFQAARLLGEALRTEMDDLCSDESGTSKKSKKTSKTAKAPQKSKQGFRQERLEKFRSMGSMAIARTQGG